MTWDDVLKRYVHADKLQGQRIEPLFFIPGLFPQPCSVLHFLLVLSVFLICHKTISWKFYLPWGCHFHLYRILSEFYYLTVFVNLHIFPVSLLWPLSSALCLSPFKVPKPRIDRRGAEHLWEEIISLCCCNCSFLVMLTYINDVQ